MTLGIIGTAGRGPDGAILKQGYYRSMYTVAQVVCELLRVDTVVSGSAAYSDHLAVRLYLDDLVRNLSLHFPTEFTGLGFKETGGQYDCGRTSNYYHSLFSAAEGINSLDELGQAVTKGARTSVGKGFKDRNTVIANEADAMLAFTFGEGPKLKDGGTADTMGKFLARRGTPVTVMMPTHTENGKSPFTYPFTGPAYHFDLNSKRLYTL